MRFMLFAITFGVLLSCQESLAQSISREASIVAGEYFIGKDPEQGQGTPIPIGNANTRVAVEISNIILQANQTIYVRFRNANGYWTAPRGITYAGAGVQRGIPITYAEYFTGADPGRGKGKSIPVTPSTAANLELPPLVLQKGQRLSIRLMDAEHRWSAPMAISYAGVGGKRATAVTYAEYFIDRDPGQGKGTSITIGPALKLPLSSPSLNLQNGQKIFFRTKDTDNRWSEPTVISYDGFGLKRRAAIASVEYFIGVDPGPGNGTKINISKADSVGLHLPSVVLLKGQKLRLRVQDTEKRWSKPVTLLYPPRFIRYAEIVVANDISKVPFGKGIPMPPADGTFESAFEIIQGVVTSWNRSDSIWVRAQSSEYFWSKPERDHSPPTPAPPAPTLASPANDATGIDTSPTLLWNAATGAASYRLQVATSDAFTNPVIDQAGITSTAYAASGLANSTRYYWRVNAANAGGTSGWSTAWNFTTVATLPPAPPAPALASPANGATGIVTNPTLQWNAATGAISYRLQVATSDAFTNPVIDQSGITGTSFDATGLANNTQYYWQVNASNAGGSSDWSTAWNFTTVATLPPAPPAPTLASPANDATGIETSPTLLWNAATGAISYRLQVATSDAFTNPVIDQSGITSTSFDATGLANNTQYYWQVNATNAGGSSGWSTAWNFTTVATLPPAPPAPTLASPANDATGIETSPTLLWNAATGAASYRIQVATSDAFTNPVIDQAGITSTAYAASGLTNNTQYYWRVNAANAGGSSGWSMAWNFTTVATLPPAPTLASPANDATGIETSPTLLWNAATGAISYRIQVATSDAFTNPVIDQAGITSTAYAASGLTNNTQYYWRVNAANAGGSSGWSMAWSFTTIVSSLPAPILASPANGATGIPTSQTLQWNAGTGAASYRIQVATSDAFTNPVVDQTGITSTAYAASGLANDTQYYWRVNASNAGGSSDWSTAWNFTTVATLPPAPPAPTLASPANDATGIDTSPTLLWNAATGAASYRLQVATSDAFTNPVIDQAGITSTAYAASGLTNDTQYYWRVNATNVRGTGEWSAVWNFTTTASRPPAPSNLTASVARSAQIDLTWRDNATNEDGYRIERKNGATGSWALLASLGTGLTAYSDVGLVDGTQYYYRVYAHNDAGKSDYSNQVHAITQMNAPSNLIATVISATEIDLRWVDNSNSESGYCIERKTDLAGVFTQIDSVGSNLTTYSNTVLEAGTVYHYRIRGYNALVQSDYSNVAIAEISEPHPDITVAPPSWDYGRVLAGITADHVFEIKNDGVAVLQIFDTSISGVSDFQIITGGGALSLSPNALHQITVRFAPSSPGMKNATLHLDSNDPDENPIEVPLTGIAESFPTGTYAFPNPFNPETTPIQIHFVGDNLMGVAIKIFDGQSNLVQTLNALTAQTTATGKIIAWDGRNVYGDFVVNGVYFYVIEAGTKERQIGKIAVLR